MMRKKEEAAVCLHQVLHLKEFLTESETLHIEDIELLRTLIMYKGLLLDMKDEKLQCSFSKSKLRPKKMKRSP